MIKKIVCKIEKTLIKQKFHLVTKLRERYGVVRDFIFRHDDALLHIHERKSEHPQQLTLA